MWHEGYLLKSRRMGRFYSALPEVNLFPATPSYPNKENTLVFKSEIRSSSDDGSH